MPVDAQGREVWRVLITRGDAYIDGRMEDVRKGDVFRLQDDDGRTHATLIGDVFQATEDAVFDDAQQTWTVKAKVQTG